MGYNLICITGPPGIGKTTIIVKVILRLKSEGIKIGGIITREKREKGERVGFTIESLANGSVGELASIARRFGPRVGRYTVNLVDLSGIASDALNNAVSNSELIVIDEIGPMELMSPEFKKAVRLCIKSGKPTLAVMHRYVKDDLADEIRSGCKLLINVTEKNRESLVDELYSVLRKMIVKLE